MKALLLTAPGVLEYTDVPEPDVGDDDLLVRVEAVGICGSDVHGMDGSSGRRVPPLVMGHEAAGVVEAVGRSVTGWAAGDAVTFDSTVYCGRCGFCSAGLTNLCDDRRVLGVAQGEWRRDGAFAERVAVPARIVHRLPPGMSMVEAALTEPLTVALHAASRAPVTAADSVLVIGAGLIGLLIVAAMREAGCERVIAVDLSPARLARATQMGATDVIQAGGDDVGDRLLALTEGRGPDIAFEAVGIGSTASLAIASVCKAGTVVLVGNVVPAVELPLQWVVSRQLTLLGSAASCGEYPQALELIAGRRVDVGRLVSEVAPLEEGAAWFARLREPGTELLKVVLRP
jgi:L-iditol 2-dehydrogenase